MFRFKVFEISLGKTLSSMQTEMAVLESQEEDAPKCLLFYKPNELAGADKDSPSG
jgi:hypothetical protein